MSLSMGQTTSIWVKVVNLTLN